MTLFSQNFKKARQSVGMTQNEVADYFGVTRGAVAQWESGAIFPESVRLPAIADLFRVSLDALFRAASEVPEGDTRRSLSKFWMVYGMDQRGPAVRHYSEDAAKTEALRLAKENPDIAFTVLEAQWGIMSKSVITEFDVRPSDDDIPF